jgi:hypothetical protein
MQNISKLKQLIAASKKLAELQEEVDADMRNIINQVASELVKKAERKNQSLMGEPVTMKSINWKINGKQITVEWQDYDETCGGYDKGVFCFPTDCLTGIKPLQKYLKSLSEIHG